MQTLWKLSQDGNSASRTLDNGSFESRLVSAIDADELTTALPADPLVTPKPTSCTMKQARLALLQAGHYSQVAAAMSSATQDVQIIWEFSAVVERSDALVVSMSAALGLTPQQVDDLFALAVTL